MKRSNLYSIAFKGLTDGVHKIEFSINDSFFELLDYSELKSGQAQVLVTLEKQSRLMVLYITINGEVLTTCDRCMDEFRLPVNAENVLYIKYINDRDNAEIKDQEIMYIEESDVFIDLYHHLYESIMLSMPIQKVHPTDVNGKSRCSKKMLTKLKSLNSQIKIKNTNIDPRWDKLKELNN